MKDGDCPYECLRVSGEGEDISCRSSTGMVESSVGCSGHRESVGDEGDVERQSDS